MYIYYLSKFYELLDTFILILKKFSMSFLLSIPYIYFHHTKSCSGWDAFLFSMAINGSFLLLFIDFYRRSYLVKKKTSAAKDGQKAPIAKKDE
ncbi:hypothetical protein HDU67_004686 [Dinochytrium kinnereticum]|nr:hypothetical protein HDU67_004686 [Dinochytrium kinnereticum]